MVILVSGERVHHIDRSRFYPDVRSPNAHQRGLFVSNEVGERQKALVEFRPDTTYTMMIESIIESCGMNQSNIFGDFGGVKIMMI